MAATVHLVRTLAGLAPADEASADALRRYRFGAEIKAVLTQPRNARFHRLYWKAMTVLHEHADQGVFPTVEDLHEWTKLALGYFDMRTAPDGRTYPRTRSIGFATMDEAGFREFFDRFVRLVCTRIIPRARSADLEREFYAVVGLSPARAAAAE